MSQPKSIPLVAIACGGTGGHFFPGLAVAEVLQASGCDVTLLISAKEVDQQAVKSITDMEVFTLPVVAMQNGNVMNFLRCSWTSYRLCLRRFRERTPKAVLAMGGFTSAPPILAGKRLGAATLLHEANTIPGRANRWLAPWVDEAFVTFSETRTRLSAKRIATTGMPVRPQFKPADASACRMALGLAPDKPVLLITGGSQGASAVNELMLKTLPLLVQRVPDLQFLHLTGSNDAEKIRAGYTAHRARAQVFPFLTEMELALGAATVAISRAGASSIAELAAMRVPSILIPYPAADDHQFYNAKALVEAGSASQIDQALATPERLAAILVDLLQTQSARDQMSAALERWFVCDAAEQIARRILKRIGLAATDESRMIGNEKSSPFERSNSQSDQAKPFCATSVHALLLEAFSLTLTLSLKEREQKLASMSGLEALCSDSASVIAGAKRQTL